MCSSMRPSVDISVGGDNSDVGVGAGVSVSSAAHDVMVSHGANVRRNLDAVRCFCAMRPALGRRPLCTFAEYH